MMEHLFGLTNLGSGSSGNATVIHTPGGAILVDAGFSGKELCARLNAVSVKPEEIRAVLVTHEHTDHTKGVRIFADTYRIPCYATAIVCRSLQSRNRIGSQRMVFAAGTPFSLCGITVEPFTVPHDAPETVAFNFLYGKRKISIVTDLGHLAESVKSRLTGADALLLESNHDLKMLAESDRPLRLKRRIMNRYGHLSNKETMEALDDILSDNTRYLLFAHLSSECNDRGIVEAMAEERLDYLARCDIIHRVANASQPTETFWIV